jgi:cytochrome c5
MAVACTKKSLPTITARTSEPSRPVTASTADIIPDLETGKTIFTNRCGRCHGLPEPAKYTSQRWETILATMIPRARLDKEQEVHITAYLKANAAK